MKEIIERIAKLIDIKSIVTLIITIDVSILALKGILPADKVFELYLIIIGFYYGTQFKKNEDKK